MEEDETIYISATTVVVLESVSERYNIHTCTRDTAVGSMYIRIMKH